MAEKKLLAALTKFNLVLKNVDSMSAAIEPVIVKRNITLVNQYKNEILELKRKLEDVYSALNLIEGQEPEQIDESYEKYLKSNYRCIDLMAQLDQSVLDISSDFHANNIQSYDAPINSNIKLPVFELPIFDGSLQNWLSFKQLFSTTIHLNPSLTDIQRLQYLQASLTGEAARLIKGFPITSLNYKAAFETLTNRYDNRRELAYALCNKMFSIKPIKNLTSKSLYELLDCCNESMRNLNSLNLKCDALSEIMLVNFIQKRIGDNLRQQWELTLEGQDLPSYQTFISFLEKQARSMQSQSAKQPSQPEELLKPKKIGSYNNLTEGSNVPKNLVCDLCKSNHSLFQCQNFIKLSVKERGDIVEKFKLCGNCLRRNHTTFACKNQFRCKWCKRKHHSLLHKDQSAPDATPQTNNQNQTVSLSTLNQSNILLSTAIIQIKDTTGRWQWGRALVDSASQMSLITTEFAERLKLKQKSTNMTIKGTGNCEVKTNSFVEIIFKNRFDTESFSTKALVTNQLTKNLPNFKITSHHFNHISDLQLADPDYHVSRPIDIIIGADLFANLLLPEKIEGNSNQPSALNSKLGWLLTGNIPHNSQTKPQSEMLLHSTNIDKILKGFWELESIPDPEKSAVNDDDHECEKIYSETITRDHEGRYIVKLPFRSNSELGESKSQAIRRFLSLENKLTKNPALYNQYKDFMNEYLALGHMEEVREEVPKSPAKCFYLPHHGIIQQSSTTTKFRVVFDASAKSSSNLSLNDVLHTGPKLQNDIFSILIRFRNHPIVMTADIEKMYRQINIAREDTDYQRIVWRNSPDQKLTDHRLLTVTYGTNCAPYLAIKTLHQLAEDEAAHLPNIAKIVKHDFYVDDLITGSDTIQHATEIAVQTYELMIRGGFKLRKWVSNEPCILSSLPIEQSSSIQSIDFNSNCNIKLLGLQWNPQLDYFSIIINTPEKVSSKRQLLSNLARIYDPLGFLSPTTILAKIMMQDLWISKISWDEEIPTPIQQKWDKFASQLIQLQSLKVPRYVLNKNAPPQHIEIHGFCDASKSAYSAVLYLRAMQDSEITVIIIAAKTKVAPLQTVTLPRLELCGALLLSQLHKAVIESFSIPISKSYFWTDSQVTLDWIHSDSQKWKVFISNRISQIQNLTQKEAWNHVPGSENPADCSSRGIMPSKLLDHNLWWQGPPFLKNPNFESPILRHSGINLPECEAIELSSTVDQTKPFIDIDHYSSYTKLLRVTAWCHRFIQNCRSNKIQRQVGCLSSKELDNALLLLVKQVQQSEFHTEIKSLQTKGILPSTNKYLSLSLFLDPQNILRVGGRLKHSNLSAGTKHPILLPKNHHLTSLVIHYFHKKALHAGITLVLSLIREKFWITSGRDTVRKHLLKCLICFRMKAKPLTQLMGNLPRERVECSKPFNKVGVDFAGPFTTKPMLIRSKVTFKSYISLFICFSTKAIHLEVVSELTTDAFLACLRRFISRRSKPAEIYSDNATNYKGTSNYLKAQIQICKSDKIQNFISEEAIIWHFIPPSAPHFGGLWESNIKSMKKHLLKTCQSATLNLEQLTTLTAQIEACLNSRPLSPLSTDPNDFSPLTPGHFLVGSSLLSFPEVAEDALPVSAKWKLVQVLRSQFWRRWSLEYLTELQQKNKWCRLKENIKLDQLVILKDNNPPLKWALGRVTKVFPGDDSLIRVVEVRTASGTFRRPVTKIVPLPLDP